MRSFMLQPEPWLFLIDLKVKNYDNWQPCLTNHYFSLQSVVKKVSTIYTDIDYIYTYMHQLKKNNCKQLNRRRCRSECGALQRGSKNEPFNCGMCGTVRKTWESNGENQWERHRESHRFRSCRWRKSPFWLLLRLGELKIRWGDLNMF